MTYKVLIIDAQKIIYCSNICSASSDDPNMHVALLGGEPSSQSAPPAVIKSRHNDADGEPKNHNMPVFSPIDLVGWTFLLEPRKDGQRSHARIVKAIKDHEDKLVHHPEHLKFLCSINDDAAEEIMSYNDIFLYHIQWDEDSNTLRFGVCSSLYSFGQEILLTCSLDLWRSTSWSHIAFTLNV